MKPAFDINKPYKVLDKPPFDPKKDFKPVLLDEFKKLEEKVLTEGEVVRLVKEMIGRIPKSEPKIVEKTVEKIVEVEKKDKTEYVDKKTIKELQQKIEQLEKRLEEPKNPAYPMQGWGFRTGRILPNPNKKDGYVVTARGSQYVLEQVTASGGGIAPGTFTISNNTPNYIFDATDSTVDALYQTVATLIRKLQGEI